jgi:hypothetical protein
VQSSDNGVESARDDVNLQGIESHGHLIGNEFNKIESLILEGTKPVYV